MNSYIRVQEKGHGAFARVDIVTNTNGDQLAMKVYDPEARILAEVGDESLKRRFKREVQYQSDISHENVVSILDSHLNEDPPYFIMPLAECSLKDELDLDQTLGGNFKPVLFDVLAGLECLHHSGYCHRDLKPANILRFENGNDSYYAISDFGLISFKDSESSNLTGSNAKGGTPLYAAPELMKNFKAATSRADIYSFGAILHDIFTSGSRVPYTELSGPGEIGRIITKCTKTLTARRYSSIAELRDDLYEVLDTTEIEFSSTGEEHVVNILQAEESLTEDQWDQAFLMLDQNEESLEKCSNIFSAIKEHHLNQLIEETPELFHALGEYFSDYITNQSFNFDYCDVLATRAQYFYKNGSIGLKAKICLALLALGTSHNRWFVERAFLSMTDDTITDALAQRIISEIKAENIDFSHLIFRLESSITANRKALHQILQNFLKDPQSV
jgi:serine/threonine protein kinase